MTEGKSSRLSRHNISAVAMLGIVFPVGAFAVDAPCGEGWLDVQAQIVRIVPPDEKPLRVKATGSQQPVGVDEVLCAGDRLVLPPNVLKVELYEGGQSIVVGKEGYRAKEGLGTGLSKASEYLKVAFGGLAALGSPGTRPTATASRGLGGDHGAAGVPIAAILPLQDLPRQQVVRDLMPIVAWRNGVAPFICEIVDEDGATIWASAKTPGHRCELQPITRRGARIAVRDSQGHSDGWNLDIVESISVPRPEWINADTPMDAKTPDLGAWALWLWQNGGADWRLQSLGMLQAAAKHDSWVARYALDGIIAEIPPVAPATGESSVAAPLYRQGRGSPDGIGKFYQGREIAAVMGFEGAQWLERPDRAHEERPDLLVDELHLQPGMTVADIGAGSGYLSRRIAPLVQPGRVFAVDVQPQMVALLEELSRRPDLQNLMPILGRPDDVMLPPASVDLAVLVDVYHELAYPFEVTRSLVRALKPGGRLVLVEYRGEDPAVPIKAVHKMTQAQVRREMSALPLAWERTSERLPWQHIVVFRKSTTGP
jgi:ubiquinone/menaquinone biosynthesis C-methylase UbiE